MDNKDEKEDDAEKVSDLRIKKRKADQSSDDNYNNNSVNDNADDNPKDDSKDDSKDDYDVNLGDDPDVVMQKDIGLNAASGYEQIMDLVVKKDDITWKTILLELVNSNKMDPWNIDLRLLAKEYLKFIKGIKQHDFRVSGKIILAAALLLKLKSVRLLEGDLNELDKLFSNTQEEDEDDLGMVDEVLPDSVQKMETYKLIPRTPQPRKRKVSIYDLVDALEKALEVKERRVMRSMPSLDVEIPKKSLDVTVLMSHLYEKINSVFLQKAKGKIYFDDLVPGDSKEDKIVTFIPLLHLTNQRKIDLEQHNHFGAIEVQLNSNKELQKEIEKELEASTAEE